MVGPRDVLRAFVGLVLPPTYPCTNIVIRRLVTKGKVFIIHEIGPEVTKVDTSLCSKSTVGKASALLCLSVCLRTFAHDRCPAAASWAFARW